MKDTIPVFILGSGRCGTKAVVKLLAGNDHVEAHHEYCRDYYQRAASMRYMLGYANSDPILAASIVQSLYVAAIHWSKACYFVDSSNKLTWVVDLLVKMFPTAKFVHLVRDGRKVVSSFYHKLPQVYGSKTETLEGWLKHQCLPLLPPEEDYWWPVPQKGQWLHKEFKTFDRFQRLCWLWMESNRMIEEGLRDVSVERKLFVQLEEMTDDINDAQLDRFLNVFDISWTKEHWEALQHPEHVKVPADWMLTLKQTNQFTEICGPMMQRMGYDLSEPEYRVKY